MNMFDEAATIDGMIKMLGLTQSEVAKRLGVSQSYVANKLRLLSFSAQVRGLIIARGLCERHARAILRVKETEEQIRLINSVADRHLSVAQCEALVDISVEATAPSVIGRAPKNERIDIFERFLSDSIESLRSLGIYASKAYSRHKGYRYITIAIEDV